VNLIEGTVKSVIQREAGCFAIFRQKEFPNTEIEIPITTREFLGLRLDMPCKLMVEFVI